MQPTADIPLRFTLGGYFRSRIVSTDNVPVTSPDGSTRHGARSAFYGFGRLRFDPAITYGSDPTLPIAAIRLQIDILDNVVFGDNARLSGVPLFGENPSTTDVRGSMGSSTPGCGSGLRLCFQNDSINLRRAWLELQVPVGQIRIGRMPSQGGNGILFNDGNGFRNDWGDAQGGSTFDRLLFATRPLSIFNSLTKGDSRPTPLVFAIAHDWLVTDPLGLAADAAVRRSSIPFEWLTRGDQMVGESVFALFWSEAPGAFPERTTDEITFGTYYIYRYQGATESGVHIVDAFWRIRRSFWGGSGLQFVSYGELSTIQGSTRGVPLPAPVNNMIDPTTGRTPFRVNANIWNAVGSVGLADRNWQALLEAGYSSGDDGVPFTDPDKPDLTFSQRGMHPDYKVGLLLYPVMLNAATALQYSETANALWSNGGIWNSFYWNPQFKYAVHPDVDLLANAVFAWADVLNFPLAPRASGATGCGFMDGDCFLGWEVDLGVKVNWGENDMFRWSNEFGVAEAGTALAPRLRGRFMWTLQSRIAMIF